MARIDHPQRFCKSKTVRAHSGLTPRRVDGERTISPATDVVFDARTALKLYPSARDPDVKYHPEWSDGWSAGQPNREPGRREDAEEWGQEESELPRTEQQRSSVSNALSGIELQIICFHSTVELYSGCIRTALILLPR